MSESLTPAQQIARPIFVRLRMQGGCDPALTKAENEVAAAIEQDRKQWAEREKVLRDALLLTRNTIGDLKIGFAKSVDPARWVEQLIAHIDLALALGEPQQR